MINQRSQDAEHLKHCITNEILNMLYIYMDTAIIRKSQNVSISTFFLQMSIGSYINF